MAALDLLTLKSVVRGARASSIPLTLRALAAHDWMLLGYLVVMLMMTLVRRGPSALPIQFAAFDLAWFAALLFAVRVRGSKSRFVSTLYRLSLIGIPLVSYLQLRWMLPVIAPGSVDADLLALDLRLFQYEPALAWDSWVTPRATEWFSFFYYSYFFLLALHAIPIALFAGDSQLLREFAFGLLFVFCAGHLIYLVVPGVGPHAYAATAGTFAIPLEGSFFWPLVRDAVAKAGAHKDIFPSLHTAVPVYLTFFSYHHRHRLPFRFTWPVLVLFASQIILATMYLRWHYLADIFAGIVLATAAAVVSRRIGRWEAQRRVRSALAPAFPAPLC
jgi:hypothetical protein